MNNKIVNATFGELGQKAIFGYEDSVLRGLYVKVTEVIDPDARLDPRTMATYNAIEVSPIPGTFHYFCENVEVEAYPNAVLGINHNWATLLKMDAEARERWIPILDANPVTLDSYPKDNEEVLGCRRDGLMDVIYHDSKTHAWYMDWIDGDSYCTDDDYDQSNGVIAWQPLPKPPYQRERRQHGTKMDSNE